MINYGESSFPHMQSGSADLNEIMNNLISKRKFKEMQNIAEKLLRSHPDNYIGLWWKARSLTFQGKLDEAIKMFFEALKLVITDKDESRVYSSISNVYNIKGARARTTSVDEACELIELGFEYVHDIESHYLYRKRR